MRIAGIWISAIIFNGTLWLADLLERAAIWLIWFAVFAVLGCLLGYLTWEIATAIVN